MGSSHEMMAIVIVIGCHVPQLSSRFRGELQNLTKEPAEQVKIPSYISNTRKAHYWQVHFLDINTLELKIYMSRRERQQSGLIN